MLRAIALLPLLFACEKECPTQVPCPKVAEPVMVADAMGRAAPSSDRVEQLKQFVRLGYGDSHDLEFRVLDFRTEEISTTDMQAILPLVPSYNAFDGNAIAKGIEPLRGQVMGWQFGREGSPAIYVHLPYWLKQQEGNCTPTEGCKDLPNDRRLTDAEFKALVAQVKSTFTALHADEIGVDTISDHIYRIWWD